MASTLPEELVEDILVRVPPDEPAPLVHASLVCKVWHSIISDGSFLRRYRRFHGTPPLLGYIVCNHKKDSTVRFVPTTSVAASPVRNPVLNHSGWTPSALDCRHGRVLIETKDSMRLLVDSLIVWDPITGTQHKLNLPSYMTYPHLSAGAVLCAKDGCDHLDCHSGPFLVVIVGTSDVGPFDGPCTWASVYSSETGAWSAPTPNIVNQYFNDGRCSLFIGDALCFTALHQECVVIKYDLCKHVLSVVHFPWVFWPILMKSNIGGLGFADMLHNCIHMWSWRAGINGIEGWVKYRVMELHTQIHKHGFILDMICMVDGTNSILINLDTGIFLLDLESEQVRKIGQRDIDDRWPILPYLSFYTPKY